MKNAFRRLAGKIIEFWWGTELANDVPALTYYLLISIVPVTLGLTALASKVLDGVISHQQLTSELGHYLPPSTRDYLVRLVTATHSSSTVLLLIAVLTMLWTSSGAIGVIERALLRMLRRPGPSMIAGKLRAIAVGAAVTGLLLFGAGATSLIAGLADSSWLRYTLPAADFVGSALLCTMIYRYSVPGLVSWRSALRGAALAGALIQLSPFPIGLYVAHSSSATGVFAVMAGIIFAMLMMSTALLIGLGTAARTELKAKS